MPPYSSKSEFLDHFSKCLSRHLSKAPRRTLSFNDLRTHTSVSVQQNEVHRVSICHCSLDRIHLKALMECLNSDRGASVREIVLNYCELTDTMSSFLATECLRKDRLQSIELFGNRISNECMQAWSQYVQHTSSLLRLKLGDNKITAQGIHTLATALSRNTSITQLHLGGNAIGDQGVHELCIVIPWKNNTITSLALRDNAITHEGCVPLSQLLKHPKCRVTDIQLKGNHIGSTGAQLLAPALAVNRSLKVLELHNAGIGPKGAASACQFMMTNDTIHAINFNQNNILDTGAEAVANLICMGRISTLGLSENGITHKGATVLAHAFNSSNLTGIDLGGNHRLGNAGATQLALALRENHTITSVDLRSCGIGTKGCIQLAQMLLVNAHLQHLDLGANMCKNDGAMELAIALSQNTTLKRLCLTDNLIHNKGGVALANGLKTNVTLVNLAYGGQGEKQNKISTPIRNIIDSIIKENKLIAKTAPIVALSAVGGTSTTLGATPPVSEEHHKQMLCQWKQEMLETSSNQNRLLDVDDVLSRYKQARRSGGCPNWIQNAVPSTFSDDELNSKVIYLFKAELLPRNNPNYKDYVYLTDLQEALMQHFPETENHVSSVQLLQFLFRRQQFYVHLPPNAGPSNMQGAQIKFLQDARPRKELYPSATQSQSPVKTPEAPRRQSARSSICSIPERSPSSTSLFSTPEIHLRSLPSSTQSSEMSFGRDLHTPSPPNVLPLSFSSSSPTPKRTEEASPRVVSSSPILMAPRKRRQPQSLTLLANSQTGPDTYSLFSPTESTRKLQSAFRTVLK